LIIKKHIDAPKIFIKQKNTKIVNKIDSKNNPKYIYINKTKVSHVTKCTLFIVTVGFLILQFSFKKTLKIN